MEASPINMLGYKLMKIIKLLTGILGIFLLTGGLFLYFTGQWTKSLVTEFTKEEKQVELRSFLTSLQGVQNLQLAELDQVEEFSETSRRKIFWEKLELPPVVVSVELPVRFTYFIDLKKPWTVTEKDQEIVVIAPPLEFNRPATDISAIKIHYEKSSMFRNEASVKDRLMKRLSTYLGNRALENKALVRETARRELGQLIEKWLLPEQKSKKISIYFQDQEGSLNTPNF